MAQSWELKINRAAKGLVKAGEARGLLLAAEHILQVSNTHVPIAPDGGTLERSGVASLDATAMKAAVSYDTPYAVRQHEELGYRHDPGRTAKYLENAGNSEASTARRIIADEIKRSIN